MRTQTHICVHGLPYDICFEVHIITFIILKLSLYSFFPFPQGKHFCFGLLSFCFSSLIFCFFCLRHFWCVSMARYNFHGEILVQVCENYVTFDAIKWDSFAWDSNNKWKRRQIHWALKNDGPHCQHVPSIKELTCSLMVHIKN